MALLASIRDLPAPASTKSRTSPTRSPSRFLRRLFCLLIFVIQFAAANPGRADQSNEYQLKAAFLFNFAQFVKWPTAAFTNAGEPFYIGILGDDPFGPALDETVQGATIANHKLVVRRARSLEGLQDCQMIFICKSEQGHLPQILSQLDSRPILSVSEIDSFAKAGGVIDFYLRAGKVRFEINPNAAQQKGLKISSQLMTLGKIVAGGGN
jgi:hypothetical protein